MKKQVRILLFALLTVLLLTLTIVGASAAGEFVVKNTAGETVGTYDSDELSAAVNKVSTSYPGYVIEVQADVEIKSSVTLNKSATYTIQGKTGSETITLTNNASITFSKGTVTWDDLNITSNSTANAIQLSGGTLIVNGGRICATNKSCYTIYVSGSANLTINDGFFTYLDNKNADSISYNGTTKYENSAKGAYNRGIYLGTSSGTVEINGGTFMSGDSYQNLEVKGKTTLHITGGKFYGHRDLKISSANATVNIYGGTFSGNPGQANSKIIDLEVSGTIDPERNILNIYGGTFSVSSLNGSPDSIYPVIYTASGKNQIAIHGGTFNCVNDKAGSTIIKLDTASNKLTIGSEQVVYPEVNGKTYGGGATFNKSGCGTAISVLGDSNTVTVSGGSFNATNLVGSLISLEGKNTTATFSGGSFSTDGMAGAIAILSGTVTVSGGDFSTTGTDIIVVAASEGSLTISGGRFTLNGSGGGTALRTSALVTNQVDLYQYYDPTTVFRSSSVPITISGGRFEDMRAGNDKVIDTSFGTSRLTVTGIFIIANSTQTYFIDAADGYGKDVMMSDASKAYKGNVQYYAYIYSAETENAPVMEDGAAVDLNLGYGDDKYNGIRFLSYIPASVVERLGLTRDSVFGTLIAPADYVALAGGFTHATMDALYSRTDIVNKTLDPNENPAYVDIRAIDSVAIDAEGNIHFSGALVRLQDKNLDRAFAAVSYIMLDDGTIYYSKYDADSNARTMKDIAKISFTDYSQEQGEKSEYHIYDSIYKEKTYSRYTYDEQVLLRDYCGYNHTLTIDEVTFHNYYSVYAATNLSTNLNSAIKAMKTKLNGFANTSDFGVKFVIGAASNYESLVNEALDEIGGEGYYIGVKRIAGDDYPYLVIVGTTNALTMQAFQVFEKNYLKAGKVTIPEQVHRSTGMVTLNADVPFVFAGTRDGNYTNVYVDSDSKDKGIDFSNDSKYNHLYNKELNGYKTGQEGMQVDYPLVAGFEIGARLTAGPKGDYNFTNGYQYTFIPDTIAVGVFHIEIGLTDYAQNHVLKGCGVGAYGFSIKKGRIVITAYNDLTLRLAKQLFVDSLADFAVDDVYKIPVDYEYECIKNDGVEQAAKALASYETKVGSDNTASTQFSNLKFIDSVTLPADLTLSGAVDVGNNTIQLYYNEVDKEGGVTLEKYRKYCGILIGEGYESRMDERSAEGSYFVTYAKGNIVIHIIYDAYAHAASEKIFDTGNTLDEMFTPTIRVIVMQESSSAACKSLPESYFSWQSYTKVTDTKLTSVQITSDSFGYCYIYTLEDGSFVVLDGGGSDSSVNNFNNARMIYNTLCALSSTDNIKIAAWYLSHGHSDHYGMMEQFISYYKSKVTIEAIIYNAPSNEEIYNTYETNPTLSNKLMNSWYSGIPCYKVHTGQLFFIRNLAFEVMYTHEDIHPYAMEFFNNTSTVIRLTSYFTENGKTPKVGSAANTNMVLGDAQVRPSMIMRARYGDYLKSDMVVFAHHKYAGAEAALYKDIDAQVIWFTHSADGLKEVTTPQSSYNAGNQQIKQNIEWLQETRWLYIISLNPLSSEMTSNKYKNLTMTLGEDGVPGLYYRTTEDKTANVTAKREAAQKELLAKLYAIDVTMYNYTVGTAGNHGVTFCKGGAFKNDSSTKDNEGFIIGRQDFSYELPITYPKTDIPTGDTVEDPFPDVVEVPEITWDVW